LPLFKSKLLGQGTSNESELGEYAWYSKNSKRKAHPVGQKRPNFLGLYDMTGNVWEWVQDRYSRDAYSKHPRKNPIYTGRSSYRVFRGGSWFSLPWFVRATDRNYSTAGYRNDNLGFRLVRTVLIED